LNVKKGKLSKDYNKLILLPGIGDYVASSWLCFHRGRRRLIIDTNIVRWLCRITGQRMDGETRRKRWINKIIDDMTPSYEWSKFNYSLLDFTMLICGKPARCFDCPIESNTCQYGRLKRLGG
jgi:A/G-specific adenine glycosylase